MKGARSDRTQLRHLAAFLYDWLDGAVREVAVYREDFFRRYDLGVAFTTLGHETTEWERMKLEKQCRDALVGLFPCATLAGPVWNGVGKGKDVRSNELTFFLSGADLKREQAA